MIKSYEFRLKVAEESISKNKEFLSFYREQKEIFLQKMREEKDPHHLTQLKEAVQSFTDNICHYEEIINRDTAQFKKESKELETLKGVIL